MANITTLQNGLRVITDTVETVDTAGFGVWVNVGTRHEDMNTSGAAHMVEHMLFKGTPTRTARDISDQIEAVGGNMNAYTGREMTAYYCHLLRDDLDLAIDVIGDMVRNSTMPDDEIERERGVILQEIKMYQDTPDDLVMDYFAEASYPDQSLGANGLGSPEHIRSMTRDHLISYMSEKYVPNNMIISVAGRIHHDEIVKKIDHDFGSMVMGASPTKIPARYAPHDRIVAKDTEQTHIVVGFEAPDRYHDDYTTAHVASVLLGGGMSSRLFQEIREKRGLVYSISSVYDTVSDHGVFGFYAGTGPEHIKELMPVALDELKKMISDPIHDDELNRAKAQMKTSVLMSRERIMSRTDQNARSMLYYNHEFRPQELIDKINRVTATDIYRMMTQILSTKPVVASVGSIDHVMRGDDISSYMKA